MAAVEQERAEGNTIYPPSNLVYRALELTAPEDVKVIILGQDPYHGPNEANGLAFSVTEGVKYPPSLRNIFKELEDDIGVKRESSELDDWARPGRASSQQRTDRPRTRPRQPQAHWMA